MEAGQKQRDRRPHVVVRQASRSSGAIVGARIARKLGFYSLIAFIMLPFIFVFWFMVTTSLKPVVDIQSPDFKWIFTPVLSNYQKVLTQTDFGQALINSGVISTIATAIGLLLGVPAAWAISREDRDVALFVLAARIVPPMALVVPWFVILASVGLVDSYLGMITAHVLLVLPIVVWFMVGFFHDFPEELEQAALVDGATRLRALVSVVVPVSRGGIAAVAVLAFVFSWNNLVYSIALSGNETKTVTVALLTFITDASVEWGSITAGATLLTIPVVLLAFVAQRQIIDGLGQSLG